MSRKNPRSAAANLSPLRTWIGLHPRAFPRNRPGADSVTTVRLLREPRFRLLVGTVGAGVAALAAAHVVGRAYQDPTIWALAGWSVTPDFEVFYQAAQAIVDGETPYRDASSPNDLGYVYPPLLAFMLIPLSFLSVSVATSLWALVSLFFVVAALYILDVRDWRCYPVALLWPFTREAIEYGTIDTLLLLVAACCWRYRDHPWRGFVSTGFAVALKLFLWPLFLWLAFTGRVKAAGFAVVAAAAFVLIPWAVIGFQGLAEYPSLLRLTAEQEDRTYSLVAIAHSLGVSGAVADAISLGSGLALLTGAFLAARGGADTRERDRRSLTFVIAACLTLTPVVWTHYLVLLLLPVALAYRRLSLVWLVPLVGTFFYAFDWYRASPEGELLPLTAVLALTTVVFASCLWTRRQADPAVEAPSSP